MRLIEDAVEFGWDKGNISKNKKHKVDDSECEEVFFDKQKVICKDPRHSLGEKRHILIGKTKKNRVLFIVFTKREKRIRVISARDINKKEKYLYEKTT